MSGNFRLGCSCFKSSFDEIMSDLLLEFEYESDYICSPRDNEIKEFLCKQIVLDNPRNRIISNKKRNANYGFAVGEFLWYLRGSESLDEMLYYNKRMSDFSDDGKTLNSAYGKRFIKDKIGSTVSTDPISFTFYSQWSVCLETLKRDKDSRRALLLINHPRDQFRAIRDGGSKDVPCTLSLQFFIRNNKLHLHTHMRSNDVMWGLTYDLFSFTLFQEYMLLELKKFYPELTLGKYYHTAGSLHLYSRHYKMAKRMIDEYKKLFKERTEIGSPNFNVHFTDPMPALTSTDGVNKLLEFEKELRENGTANMKLLINVDDDAVLWMADQLINHRRKRDEE